MLKIQLKTKDIVKSKMVKLTSRKKQCGPSKIYIKKSVFYSIYFIEFFSNIFNFRILSFDPFHSLSLRNISTLYKRIILDVNEFYSIKILLLRDLFLYTINLSKKID